MHQLGATELLSWTIPHGMLEFVYSNLFIIIGIWLIFCILYITHELQSLHVY